MSKMQALVSWTNELILFSVIAKIFCPELMLTNNVRITIMMSILVKSVVLEIVSSSLLLQIGIIFFTAIARITHDFSGQPSQPLAHPFQVRDQAGSIPCLVVSTKPDDELGFCADLDVVGRFGPGFFIAAIFFHAHADRIRVCF